MAGVGQLCTLFHAGWVEESRPHVKHCSLSVTLTNQAGAVLGLKFSELVQACSNSVDSAQNSWNDKSKISCI